MARATTRCTLFLHYQRGRRGIFFFFFLSSFFSDPRYVYVGFSSRARSHFSLRLLRRSSNEKYRREGGNKFWTRLCLESLPVPAGSESARLCSKVLPRPRNYLQGLVAASLRKHSWERRKRIFSLFFFFLAKNPLKSSFFRSSFPLREW